MATTLKINLRSKAAGTLLPISVVGTAGCAHSLAPLGQSPRLTHQPSFLQLLVVVYFKTVSLEWSFSSSPVDELEARVDMMSGIWTRFYSPNTLDQGERQLPSISSIK